MRHESIVRAVVAQRAGLMFLLAAPALGCGDAQGQAPGSGQEPTAESEQAVLSDDTGEDCPFHHEKDPPASADPSPSDCGVNDTRGCTVTTAFTSGTFTSLQAAINAAPDGDVLMVRGKCGTGNVVGRTNLTIQGPFVACGFNGPSPTQLQAEVRGLNVQSSTNISVRFLNLIQAGATGLQFVDSVTPIVSCNCAAHNGADGVRLLRTQAAVLSQNLSELNTTNGVESSGTSTIIISQNTVTANRGNGIFVNNATNNNVSFNIVTNNGGFGILFSNVTNSLATGNTITGNGQGRNGFITCQNGSRLNSGTNVPASCF